MSAIQASAVVALVGAKTPHPGARGSDELADLIRLASGGCRASFEKLYRRTSGGLYGIILRVNRDRAEAEEVLQETYVKVWSECKQFDPNKGLATYWLASIARNAAIDSLKRRSARPKRDFTRADDEDNPYKDFRSTEAGPLEVLILRRRSAAIQVSLRALSPDMRDVLTLAFYGGLSYEEVACKLCRPVGTVKSRVRRALLGLRTSLDAA